MEIVKDHVFTPRSYKTARKSQKAAVNLEEAVSKRAYELYVERGVEVSSPEEQLNDWQQAEREIREEQGLA